MSPEKSPETGPFQKGYGDFFKSEQISRNVAENMPFEELSELVEEFSKKVADLEKANPTDPNSEILKFNQDQLAMLEEVLNSRQKKAA